MSELTELGERLTMRREEMVFLQPCADVVLYWSGSPFDRAEGLVAFYRKAIELLGKDFKFFRTETMSAAKRLKKDTLELLPFWFDGEPKGERDIFMLFLESGAKADEPSDRAFALDSIPGAGYVRLIVPIGFLDRDPPAFVELALSLAATMPYDFGEAGLAVNWNPLGLDDERAIQGMHALGNRYPGIDMSDPFGTKFVIGKGIKGINWLTFINPAQVAQLGGLAALEAKLGDGLVLHRLAHGAAIQAGPAPVAGDNNRRIELPAYRAAGRLLAPLRSAQHPAIIGADGFVDKEATDKWLARFDS